MYMHISLGSNDPYSIRSSSWLHLLTSSSKIIMPKLRFGVGAECSVLTRFIHPSAVIRAKYPNLEKAHRTSVILIGEESTTVRRKSQDCFTFRSGDFENEILYAVKKHLKVIKEGSPKTILLKRALAHVDEPTKRRKIAPIKSLDHSHKYVWQKI